MSATWCRDLRRRALSYRAVGEEAGMREAKVRRLILRLEHELAPPG
jgi:hypothetical protein